MSEITKSPTEEQEKILTRKRKKRNYYRIEKMILTAVVLGTLFTTVTI